MDRLAQDTLWEVFGFLAAPSLRSCRLVCKKWYTLLAEKRGLTYCLLRYQVLHIAQSDLIAFRVEDEQIRYAAHYEMGSQDKLTGHISRVESSYYVGKCEFLDYDFVLVDDYSLQTPLYSCSLKGSGPTSLCGVCKDYFYVYTHDNILFVNKWGKKQALPHNLLRPEALLLRQEGFYGLVKGSLYFADHTLQFSRVYASPTPSSRNLLCNSPFCPELLLSAGPLELMLWDAERQQSRRHSSWNNRAHVEFAVDARTEHEWICAADGFFTAWDTRCTGKRWWKHTSGDTKQVHCSNNYMCHLDVNGKVEIWDRRNLREPACKLGQSGIFDIQLKDHTLYWATGGSICKMGC